MNKKGDVNIPEIKEIVANINKNYGEGTITTLEKSSIKDQNFLSSGSLILNQLIGGGYVFGRIVEIYGSESSGKTTLALHAVAECQKLAKRVAYIDLENALDVKYAKNIGVKTDELLIVYPKNGEKALDLVAKLIEEGVSLIIIDSVAALIPKVGIRIRLGKTNYRLTSPNNVGWTTKKINMVLTKKEAIVIFINQIRNKISTGGYFGGSMETTAGGRALSYYASLRIRLREKEKIEKGTDYIGIRVQTQIKKNKLASPYQESVLEIIFSYGIQIEREVIDLAVEKKIMEKNGN